MQSSVSCKLNRKSFCRNFENAAYFHNEVIETSAVASHHHFLDVSSSGNSFRDHWKCLGVPTPCSHIALCSLQATQMKSVVYVWLSWPRARLCPVHYHISNAWPSTENRPTEWVNKHHNFGSRKDMKANNTVRFYKK